MYRVHILRKVEVAGGDVMYVVYYLLAIVVVAIIFWLFVAYAKGIDKL